MRNIWVIVAILPMLSACVQQQLQMERQKLSGFPVAYQDGYVDGCGSGKKAAGNPYAAFVKDVLRFDSDKQYGQGWTDGFNVCKGDYESISRALR